MALLKRQPQPTTQIPSILAGGAQPGPGPLPTPQINPTFSNRPNVNLQKPFSINPIADNSQGAQDLITKAFPQAPNIAHGIQTGDWAPYFQKSNKVASDITAGLKPGATPEQKKSTMDYLVGSINPEGGVGNKIGQEIAAGTEQAVVGLGKQVASRFKNAEDIFRFIGKPKEGYQGLALNPTEMKQVVDYLSSVPEGDLTKERGIVTKIFGGTKAHSFDVILGDTGLGTVGSGSGKIVAELNRAGKMNGNFRVHATHTRPDEIVDRLGPSGFQNILPELPPSPPVTEANATKQTFEQAAPELFHAIQRIPAELMAQVDTITKHVVEGNQAPPEIWSTVEMTFKDAGINLPKDQGEAADVVQQIVPHYNPPEVPLNTVSHTPSEQFHPPGNSGQPEATAITDSIKAFTDFLQNDAPALQKEQAALTSAARTERIAKSQAVQTPGGGIESFMKEKAQLAGEIPKVQYEAVLNKLPKQHIDNLFNAVSQSKNLRPYEKISARNSLQNLLGLGEGTAKPPTAGEIDLLNRVFPKALVEGIQKSRPFFQKAADLGIELINAPRTLLSSLDYSAPMRQGLFLIGKPVRFAQAFGSGLKQQFSEKAFQAVQESIRNRPTFDLMNEAGLAITDVGGNLENREERFMSNLLERVPGVGRFFRGSARGYTGFLNKLRADVFDDMLLKMQNTVGVTPDRVKQMASFINAASGRGDLAKFGRSSEILNGVFFSPRLMASRIQLLRQVTDPVFIAKQDPFVRKEAWKTLLSSASILGTMGSMLALGGGKVNWDPTNADFLKVRFGNTRYDLGGGITQYVRLMAQIATGKITSSTTGKVTYLGQGYKPTTDMDVIMRFLQNKENPIFSLAMETPALLRGNATNAIGQPTDIPTEVRNRIIPLIGQDIRDAVAEVGPVGIFSAGVPATLGVGVQTYASSAATGPLKPQKTGTSKSGLKPRTTTSPTGGLKPR